MRSTVQALSPTRARLEFEVPFAELEPSLRKAQAEPGSQLRPGAVLIAATTELLPGWLGAAIREHGLKPLSRPQIQLREYVDGQPLTLTAELDVRPVIALPDFGSIEIVVDAAEVTDQQVDEQVYRLRERFATLTTVRRPARPGDQLRIDLNAQVDGEVVPGGTASDVSYVVGSGRLAPGLDDALDGLSAGESTTFGSRLVRRGQPDRDAEVTVTVHSVREKHLPEFDDAFTGIASEFDTVDGLRADLRSRLWRVRRAEQLDAARDQALTAIAAPDVPLPEVALRDEVASRKEELTDELTEEGVTLDAYLTSEGMTVAELDAELAESAAEAVRAQIVLDTLTDQEGITLTDEEFGAEIVRRARQAGTGPQEYYERLVRAGDEGSLSRDLRRGKALSAVMERLKITDSNGDPISL